MVIELSIAHVQYWAHEKKLFRITPESVSIQGFSRFRDIVKPTIKNCKSVREKNSQAINTNFIRV